MEPKEFEIKIEGHIIRGQSFGDARKPTVLALHGWLDNSNSFEWLAKHLCDSYYVIAVDLPGHGLSTHIPTGAHYHFIDSIFFLKQIIEKLNRDPIHLLGHSLGACIASMGAGILRSSIRSLILIENIGPLSATEDETFEQLHHYSKEYMKFVTREKKVMRSLKDAAHIRSIKGYISYDLAYQLCKRGTEEVADGVRWVHDLKLQASSPLRLTENQVLDCLKEITMPTLLILATKGFGKNVRTWDKRIAAVENIQTSIMEGGHHIHMEKPEKSSKLIKKFLQSI
tara:strand:+ start:270 stop:1121 length:852 start_codon:yes stop_codon:yes gene_type:complete